MNVLKKIWIISALVLLQAGISLAQAKIDSIAPQIDKLFSRYNDKTPGVAIAVVKDGKVVFTKGHGAANLEFDRPITSKTVFQIASVSKQFTAFAVYLLEKQGKISLEDDVRKYIPELPVYPKTVRIRHLLAHTSGINDQAALLSLAGWRESDVTTTADVLRFVTRQKELNFEPGSRFLYSNTGYALVGEIVRRASGESFAEFARKNIFLPLAMNDTQIGDDSQRIVKNRADSYELENGSYKRKFINDSVAGASNLYTTVEDMAKWSINLESAAVGGRELVERFNAPSLLDKGERVVWGTSLGSPGYHAKGQIHWNYRGLRLMSHGGHTAAFRSFHGRFPDERLSVIAFSNDEHYANFDDSIKIAQLFLADKLKPVPANTNAKAPVKPATKPVSDLRTFEGRFYNEELETFYDATVVNGKPFLTHMRHGALEFADDGNDKLSGRIGFPVEISLLRDNGGAIVGFSVSNFGAKGVKFVKTRYALAKIVPVN